jgi:hypothetical protein
MENNGNNKKNPTTNSSPKSNQNPKKNPSNQNLEKNTMKTQMDHPYFDIINIFLKITYNINTHKSQLKLMLKNITKKISYK